MKKSLLLLIVCLLLSASGRAAISPRLDSLAYAVLRLERLPVTGTEITLSEAKWAVNAAIPDVCEAFDAVEKTVTLRAHEVGSGVCMPSDFLRIKEVQRKSSGGFVPLSPIEPAVAYQSVQGKKLTDGTPVEDWSKTVSPFNYWVTGDTLFFSPKVSRSVTEPDTFVVSYWSEGKNLTSDTMTTDVQAEWIRTAIVLRAAQLVAVMRKNWNDAAQYEKMVVDLKALKK